MAARLIETGTHAAIPLPGRVHGKQLARLCELIQELTDRNGGWGKVHLDIRGGCIHSVSTETTELFALEKLPTA